MSPKLDTYHGYHTTSEDTEVSYLFGECLVKFRSHHMHWIGILKHLAHICQHFPRCSIGQFGSSVIPRVAYKDRNDRVDRINRTGAHDRQLHGSAQFRIYACSCSRTFPLSECSALQPVLGHSCTTTMYFSCSPGPCLLVDTLFSISFMYLQLYNFPPCICVTSRNRSINFSLFYPMLTFSLRLIVTYRLDSCDHLLYRLVTRYVPCLYCCRDSIVPCDPLSHVDGL